MLLKRKSGNKNRWYLIAVGQDIFGAPALLRAWGRNGGRWQRARADVCGSIEEATEAASKLTSRKIKKGYKPESTDF